MPYTPPSSLVYSAASAVKTIRAVSAMYLFHFERLCIFSRIIKKTKQSRSSHITFCCRRSNSCPVWTKSYMGSAMIAKTSIFRRYLFMSWVCKNPSTIKKQNKGNAILPRTWSTSEASLRIAHCSSDIWLYDAWVMIPLVRTILLTWSRTIEMAAIIFNVLPLIPYLSVFISFSFLWVGRQRFGLLCRRPLRRFAPCALRWQTLTRLLSSAPFRVRTHVAATKKRPASASRFSILWWAVRGSNPGPWD